MNETGAAPTATYAGARAAMAVRAFSSVKTRFTAGDGHIPYPVFSARTPPTVPPQPAYLDLVTVDRVDDAWFMVALVPGKNIEAANASAAKLTTARGARVVRAAGTERDGRARRRAVQDGHRAIR